MFAKLKNNVVVFFIMIVFKYNKKKTKNLMRNRSKM